MQPLIPVFHKNSGLPERTEAVVRQIIGLAIEVHRTLGPGLLEYVYQSALSLEFQEAGLQYERELRVPALYKSKILGEYRLDFLVENSVIVEVKSVERLDPLFEAQLLTYLRVTGKRVGLLMNFNSKFLRSGLRRFIL